MTTTTPSSGMTSEQPAEQRDWVALENKYYQHTFKRNLVMEHGEGARVWDATGKEYLDLVAGIATNVLLALLAAGLFVLLGALGNALPAAAPVLGVLQLMTVFGVTLNLLLAAFNLIPIPPLDGSHVVTHLLPPSWAVAYQRFGRFGLLLLILLIQTPFLGFWFAPVTRLARALLGAVRPFALTVA